MVGITKSKMIKLKREDEDFVIEILGNIYDESVDLTESFRIVREGMTIQFATGLVHLIVEYASEMGDKHESFDPEPFYEIIETLNKKIDE